MLLSPSFRFALRVFTRRPAFAASVAATLGLGLSAALCAISVTEAALGRAAPFPASDRLFWIGERGSSIGRTGISIPQLRRWGSESRTLRTVAAFSVRSAQLLDAADVTAITVARVSTEFFSTLAVPPSRGRGFREDDDRLGASSVAVISNRLWNRQFAGDTTIVGHRIRVDGIVHDVIGVMPPTFAFPSEDIDLWTPLLPSFAPFAETEGPGLLLAIGRAMPGVETGAIAIELAAIEARVVNAVAPSETLRPYAESLRDHLTQDLRPRVRLLQFAAALMLLLTWANAAIMLVNRQLERRHELMVHRALGAEGRQLYALVFMEAACLALAGVVIGAALMGLVLRLAREFALTELPELASVRFGPGLMVAALALAIASAAVISGIALLEARRSEPMEALRESGSQQSTKVAQRARLVLVVSSIAASIALASSAAALGRNFRSMAHQNMGFDARDVYRTRVDLPITTYTPEMKDGVEAFMSELLTTLKSQGVLSSVAIATESPGGGNRMVSRITRNDRGDNLRAGVQAVSADYFNTLRMRLQEGRSFTSADGEGGPEVPAVVDASFARAIRTQGSVIGKTLDLSDLAMMIRIVGVVPDVRQQRLTAEPLPQVYLPYGALPLPWVTLLVRSAETAPLVRERVGSMIKLTNARQPAERLEALTDVLAARIDSSRFYAVLLIAFALSSIAVSVVGLYGVIALSVAQRRTEFGIRMALGATGQQLFMMVVGSCLRMTGAGIVIGVAMTAASSRIVAALLFGENPLDLLVVLSCSATIAAIAIAAGMLAAWQVSTMSPAGLLRSD
ncbi:MAG: ABC transporter permease [Gemmatimonadetes bacterium]|nr:ABC transporter permease [Gemmatimonadota bacterium]